MKRIDIEFLDGTEKHFENEICVRGNKFLRIGHPDRQCVCVALSVIKSIHIMTFEPEPDDDIIELDDIIE